MTDKDTRRVVVALLDHADLQERKSRRRSFAGARQADTRKWLRQDAAASKNLALDISAGHIVLTNLGVVSAGRQER